VINYRSQEQVAGYRVQATCIKLQVTGDKTAYRGNSGIEPGFGKGRIRDADNAQRKYREENLPVTWSMKPVTVPMRVALGVIKGGIT
jgi:hypothetical protein